MSANATESVRVGVWGVGAWGERHARTYAALPGVDLVGVFDRNAERARAVAERVGCRTFPSADRLLEACEAVSIAVATVGHRAALEQCAAAGRHALVEKPLAPTVEDADAMLAAAKRAGTVLQVGHVERFNPAWIASRAAVSGVKFVEAHRLALFQPRSLDIDVVFDLMIHDLDLVLDAIGASPVSVSAVGVAVLSDNEDIANARLEFENGCVANLTASRVSQERLRRIRFFQHDAYLSIDLFKKSAEILRVGPPGGDPDRVRAALAAWRAAAAAAASASAGTSAALAAASPGHDGTRGPGSGPMDAAGLDSRLAEAFRREQLSVGSGEPLALELAAFTASLRGRGAGAASATAGRAALAAAAEVRRAMQERARRWEARSSAIS